MNTTIPTMQKVIFVSFFVCLVVCGCTLAEKSAKTMPNKADVVANPAQLEQGKRIYTTKCGEEGNYSSCHGLHATNEFRRNEWTHKVAEMAPRANLTAAEARLVLMYVQNGAKK